MAENFVGMLLQSGAQIETLSAGVTMIALGLFLVVFEMAKKASDR